MYDYQKERERIFTDQGQRTFLVMRDAAFRLLRKSGACTREAITEEARFGACDNWFLLACLDRMIELEELVRIDEGNHTIYVWGPRGRAAGL